MIQSPLMEMDPVYREHIKSLVCWLLDEVNSSCGDGDAVWIVKTIPLDELRILVQDECLNARSLRYWSISEVVEDQHGRRFSLTNGEEALVFTTTDHDVPSWSQCTITL